jgi:hypothetical protein
MPEELQTCQSDLLGIIASSNAVFFFYESICNEIDNTHYKFKIQDFAFGTTNFG